MSYRKLRIAWSVACAIACVLLIVLWVRSYWRADSVMAHYRNVTPLGHYFLIASNQGRCACLHITSGVFPWWSKWTVSRLPKEAAELFPFNVTEERTRMGFGAYWLSPTDYGVLAPHWFLVVLTCTLAVLSWMPWRFSLRTLLIVTTLVAVVLGVVVYAAR